jgi:hypothetical protein
MTRGDHLRVERLGYFHHGIDLGNGFAVHFTNDNSGTLRVHRTALTAFAQGRNVEVVEYGSAFHRDYTCLTALHMAHQPSSYHFWSRNCEHVATFCKTGRWESHQIREATERMGRDARKILMNPAAPLLAPIAEAVRFLVRAGFHGAKRLVTSPATIREYGGPRTPAIYREADRFVDAQGGAWLRRYDGAWSRWTGSTFAPSATSPVDPTFNGAVWRDENLVGIMETPGGWLGPSAEPLPEAPPAFNAPQRPKRLAAAPINVLNAMLELPSSLDELHAALAEICVRGCGDATTYEQVFEWIVWKNASMPAGAEDVRYQACVTFGSLHRFQFPEHPAAQIFGLANLGAIAADENEHERVRVGAVEAIGLMWRSPDDALRTALEPARKGRSRNVREVAERLLQSSLSR